MKYLFLMSTLLFQCFAVDLTFATVLGQSQGNRRSISF